MNHENDENQFGSCSVNIGLDPQQKMYPRFQIKKVTDYHTPSIYSDIKKILKIEHLLS
jgi:hypothetical protein